MISGYNEMAIYKMNYKKDYIRLHAEEMEIIEGSLDFYDCIRNIASARKYTLRSILEGAQIDEAYGYKLVRSKDVKHTNNQDLIIALAASMKIGLDATQCLLRMYGLALLDVYAKDNDRQGIICKGLINRVGVQEINRELFERGLEILKTRKGRTTSEKGDKKMTKANKRNIESFAGYMKPNRIKKMIDYRWQAEPFGIYDPDVAISIELMVEFENNDRHVISIYWNSDETQYAVYRIPVISWSENIRECLWQDMVANNDEGQASYEDLDDDWQYYKEEIGICRQKLSEVIAEVMTVVDDTKNYDYRISDGAREGTKRVVEMFYRYKPSDNDFVGKETYLQVTRTESGYRYTASNKSYYLLYHLGKNGYRAWYGREKKEKYFIDIDDVAKLVGEEQGCFCAKFKQMEQLLIQAH